MSYLAIPETHPLLVPTGSKARDKLQRRHQEVQVLGTYLLVPFLRASANALPDVLRATLLFKKAIPSIQAFIESRVKSWEVDETKLIPSHAEPPSTPHHPNSS